MRTLFVAWQDPDSRNWFPVARLWLEQGIYRFVYVGGVQAAISHGFRLLASFSRTDIIYSSHELFPLFRNRVMSKSRQDFGEFVSRLNLVSHSVEPFDILSREARRATDHLEMFPMPEVRDGFYWVEFLVRGLRYCSPESQQRVNTIAANEQLYPLLDTQNRNDSSAVLLRTHDLVLVGYVPRFLAAEIKDVLVENPEAITIAASKVNLPPIPIQHRLLCHLSVRIGAFLPYSSPEFQPLLQYPPVDSAAAS